MATQGEENLEPGKPPPAKPPDTNWTRFLEPQVLGSFGIWLIGSSLGGAIIFGLFKSDIVKQLGNADLARGVITFIFATGTIGIALLVALGALLGDKDSDRLAKAKEVLTVLIGIFGTILGFYFGTATNGNAQKLEITDIKITDKQLATHVAGGTPPYRYSITSSESEFKPIKDQTADGWIIKPIDPLPTKGKITVDITDSRDLKGSRDHTLSTEMPTASASLSPPAKGATTSSATPTATATATPTATPALAR